MALASVQSYLSTYQSNLWSSFSCGPTPLRCVQSQGCSSGQKAPLSLFCQGHLASLQLEHAVVVFRQTIFGLFASSLMDPVAALIAPLSASSGLFVSTFLTPLHHSFQLEAVKNIAGGNGSILIMQMLGSTDGMFCFINCVPLSGVKLYLSNFREIVTRFQFGLPAMPPSIQSEQIQTNISLQRAT